MKKMFTFCLLLLMVPKVRAQFNISTFAKVIDDYVVVFENDTTNQVVRPSVMPKFGTKDIDWLVSILYSRYLTRGLVYPEEALKQHIRGSVLYTLCIDKTGKAKDIKLVKGIGGGCDEEAFKYLQLIPDTISPALYQGEPVDVQMMIPFCFDTDLDWPVTVAKDFDIRKWCEDNAIIVGNPEINLPNPRVNNESEIEFEKGVPYVRFVVKKKNNEIKKIEIVNSSGFESLDRQATGAIRSMRKWFDLYTKKDITFIVPIKFDPNL